MDDVEAAVIAAAEEHVRSLVPRPTWPSRDCLACYLHRALRVHGCDGKLTLTHKWQGEQRILRRRTGGLTEWLKRRGGFCDCEVLMNVYPDREPCDDPLQDHCPHPVWR
jgi:hypothetical protein